MEANHREYDERQQIDRGYQRDDDGSRCLRAESAEDVADLRPADMGVSVLAQHAERRGGAVAGEEEPHHDRVQDGDGQNRPPRAASF